MTLRLFRIGLAGLLIAAAAGGPGAFAQRTAGPAALTENATYAKRNAPTAPDSSRVEVGSVSAVEIHSDHSVFEVNWTVQGAAQFHQTSVNIIAILIGVRNEKKEGSVTLNLTDGAAPPTRALVTINHGEGLLPYIEQEHIRLAVTVSISGRSNSGPNVLTGTKESRLKVNRPS